MTEPVVAVVGSINMDLVVQSDRLPGPGENVMGSAFRMVPGGKGANQAVAAARMGAHTCLVGSVGLDTFGENLLAGLADNAVDVSGVKRDPASPTGVALIVVDAVGENRIIIVGGANGKLGTEDVLQHRQALVDADVILLQLEIPYDTVEAVIQLAREHSVPVILDAGPPCESVREAFFEVDVLSPNEVEAEALVGMPISDLITAEAAGQQILARGAGAAVIKLGAKGAMLVTEKGGQHFPAFDVDPVDTTAAGDAFTASLAVQLARGGDIEDAVGYANAAGAIAVTKFGAQPSVPTLQEVESLHTHQTRTGERRAGDS